MVPAHQYEHVVVNVTGPHTSQQLGQMILCHVHFTTTKKKGAETLFSLSSVRGKINQSKATGANIIP